LYQLTVDGYSGDAGNAMMTSTISDGYVANGRPFTTMDSDNDINTVGNCGVNYGWWYGWCSTNLLNTDTNAIWVTGSVVYDVEASRMLVKFTGEI